MIKKIIRFLLWSIGAVAAFFTLFFAVAYLLVLMPTNNSLPTTTVDASQTVEAYVRSNGVHTDVILPIKSATIDWTTYFPVSDMPKVPDNAEFIAIGWGDKEFYLGIPTWADLTVPVAISAVTGQNDTLLHVEYLTRGDLYHYYQLPLNTEQYQQLSQHILASAELKEGKTQVVANAHNGAQDSYYEAVGRYTLFNTCNTWLASRLRESGVKMTYWAPFANLVTWYLKPLDEAARQ